MGTPGKTQLGIAPAGAWTVVAGGAAGLAATCWDDAWHTVRGRDSTFIPPHLMLYGSMALVGLALGIWVLTTLLETRSPRATLATPGLALAVAAGITTAGAAPADAVWHATFGRDAVLWSPPHLLSVLATAVLVVAVLLGLRRGPSAALRIALGAVLLGAAELVVLEYETDVPQFSEALHLPLIVLLGLGVAWISRTLSGPGVRFSWSVLAYLGLRLLLLLALTSVDWIAPDVPIALLGLLVLDIPSVRLGRARWPLAGVAVAALQLAASATGVSSVAFGPTATAAAILIPLLAAVLVTVAAKGRTTQTALVLVALLAASLPLAPAARAHDPGQGKEVATAEMTAQRTTSGTVSVHIGQVSGAAAADLRPVRLVARRAGQTVAGPLEREGEGFAGSVELTGTGLWLVYGELRTNDQAVEIWLPVPADSGEPASGNRPIYLPAGAGPRPAGEYVAGAVLLILGFGLVGWAALAVRRRATTQPSYYQT